MLTLDEKIYTLLKFMMSNIESKGLTIKQNCFDFMLPTTTGFITLEKMIRGGLDFQNFSNLSRFKKSEIEALLKICYSREFINYNELSLVWLKDKGVEFVNNYELSKQHLSQHITVNGNVGQVGNNNTQTINIDESFQNIMNVINNSNANDKEKNKAKGWLQKLLEHPIIAPLVTDALRALFKT